MSPTRCLMSLSKISAHFIQGTLFASVVIPFIIESLSLCCEFIVVSSTLNLNLKNKPSVVLMKTCAIVLNQVGTESIFKLTG